MKKKRDAALIERAYESAIWLKNLRETSNGSFFPLFFDEHRYLVLKGGGGSGKSIFAGRKILERSATESGHRFLVVRKVATTLRESCFEQLKSQAYEFYAEYVDYIPKGKSGDMYIRMKNGSEIIFAGLDDTEKLKSIYDITGIWIEEASEIDESDFNQLDIRLRTETPHYLQFVITFNPVSIMHWLKRRFFDFDISDPEERCKAIAKTRVHESTYKDNRFLRPEAIEVLEAYRETDEYYYMVYCLGMWGVTGKTVFDRKALSARLGEIGAAERIGLFIYSDDGLALENMQWDDSPSGPIRVYKKPEPGVPYVIGCDTAGEGSDNFVAQVLDNRTGEQVCTLSGKFDEDVFARQVYCLGMWYNKALIGVETNFSTYPAMELERLKYPKQYVRETVDDFTHKIKHSFGFCTDRRTRPVIISELIKEVRDDVRILFDSMTIEEMLTFVRNESTLRPEAESGAHDDCVMALAIAHHIRPQQSYLMAADEEAAVRWTASQLEDYENASPSERQILIKKWGRPKR